MTALLSPPPPYPSLPSTTYLQQLPSLTRPSPIRSATSPALLSVSNPTTKPIHRSLLSRISNALRVPTRNETNQTRTSRPPNKLRKPRPQSGNSQTLRPTPEPIMIINPWVDSQDEDSSSEDEHTIICAQRQRHLGPIRAFVKRTPVHFLTGHSEVLEVKTIWPDGREVVTRPSRRLTMPGPEDWMGWPSRQQ
ncbi:hypothetical protein CROQUDRAFT_659760 [Cronartium quercuum f. sp. fusiforme G11]|uniref:Uncharacterized protein n=1 Tax=Cronartium quercuum f. sp. fusiforme G11 TaxID=708437 RepID=A0A9P6TAG1_9BASI|nr:hypothetical protein CROQUDRAFT_659760 [Cronartium quercuum f. sp. fusiforme G11]